MYQLDSRKYWSDLNVPIKFEFRNPQSPFPLHIHDFHEMVLVYSGKATHLTPNGDHEIQGGDFVSVKLGQAHGYKNIQNLVLMNILIKPSFFKEDHFKLSSFPAYGALFGPGKEKNPGKAPIVHIKLDYGTFSRATELVESANAELLGRSDGYRAMVVSLILEFSILLIRNYKSFGQVKSGFARDTSALFNYVKQNYRSPLDMAVLSGVSGMSKSRVQRAFKQYLGSSPLQYISKLRLSAAKDALIQTNKTITEVALDLGFNDSNYFTRLFKKNLGLSPREYRDKFFKENLL